MPVPTDAVYVEAGRRRLPPLQPRARTLVVTNEFMRTQIEGVNGGPAQRRLSSWSREYVVHLDTTLLSMINWLKHSET